MKLKKIISAALASAMLAGTAFALPTTAAEDTASLPFEDVEQTWYYDAVESAYNEGIMKGKSDTIFDPTAKITRAEVVTAFARIACVNIEGYGEKLDFTDTEKDSWYSDSVGWAAENGIVKGRGDGRFSPSDLITRQELASVIMNFISYMGIETGDNAKIDTFSDADTFADWAKPVIESVRKTGLMQGKDGGRFAPTDNAMRAEIATVAANVLPSAGRNTVAAAGESDYVIVIDEENADAADAAERMVWQLEETTGATLEVVDDGTSATAKEIVLGKTARGAKVDTSGLVRDEYKVVIDGEKVYIDGATADGLYGGAVDFMNAYTGGNGLRFTDKSGFDEEFEYPVGKLTIAGNDISKYTVYYPADADTYCTTAAEKLSYYIEEACGVKLPVKTGDADNYGIIIKYTESDEKFDDSFNIKNDGTNIVISGHRDRGAVFGAYDFLEEYVGVRFIGDADKKYTDKFTIVEAESLDITGVDDTEEPYFTYRVSTVGRSPSGKLWRDLVWGTHQNCHTFGWLMNDDPLNDPYLDGNIPCLTDEAMIAKLIKNVRIQIEYYTEKRGVVPDIVSVSYTDNANYCKCDSCEEINNKYASPAATLVLFMNTLCEDLAEDYPDMKVQTLAYWHTLTPPVGLKAHPNVVVQYCTISNCYNHPLDYSCYANKLANEQISGWAEVADELHIWDYGNNWAYEGTPYPIMSYVDIMEKHQFLYENNVDLMFQCIASGRCGNFQQICTYMYGLAMWDPYMSEETYYEYMQDACEGFYGEGWEYVYNAIMTLEENYTRCATAEQSPSEAMMQFYMKSYIDDLISDMKKARLLAETKYQWGNIDCAMMQFEWVMLDSVFDKLYNSTDTADNELLQEMCRELYSKFIKYKLKISLTAGTPPMPEKFEESPSYWKNWAFRCIDPNGDGSYDDRLFDKTGWLVDEVPSWFVPES